MTKPSTENTALRGRIACVGLSMTLGSHLTPLARSHIEQSDVVFAIAAPRCRSSSRACAEMALRDLPATDVTAGETLILPPTLPLRPNKAVRERLAALDAGCNNNKASS